jgi:ubiquinone/menaquinone biosynthesis C-methylase UbiE
MVVLQQANVKLALSEIDKKAVREFWNTNPCGAKFVDETPGSKAFFDSLTKHRYWAEAHIPEMVNFPQWCGRRVLEVGCGLGTDAEQFARNGAVYTGIDLTDTSIDMCRNRFTVQGLSGTFKVADAERLPFPNDSFDLVYSHGVIHHTPNTEAAVAEIHRVLRPGGTAIVMLYHSNSWNYWGNINVLRRVGVILLFVSPRLVQIITKEPYDGLVERRKALLLHPALIFNQGWFLSQNTDGVGNPISKVYSRKSASALFGQFATVSTQVRFLHTKWLPGGRLLSSSSQYKLAARWGWHLWITAVKADS